MVADQQLETRRIIALFDVDGTLTAPRKVCTTGRLPGTGFLLDMTDWTLHCRTQIQLLWLFSRSCARFAASSLPHGTDQRAVGQTCLLQYIKVGIVGGSDEVKICEQLGGNGQCCDRAAQHNQTVRIHLDVPTQSRARLITSLLRMVLWPTSKLSSLQSRA